MQYVGKENRQFIGHVALISTYTSSCQSPIRTAKHLILLQSTDMKCLKKQGKRLVEVELKKQGKGLVEVELEIQQ